MEAEHALQTVSRIVCCRAHHHFRDCGVNASSPSHHIAQRELVLANEAIINMAAKLLEVIIAKIPTSITNFNLRTRAPVEQNSSAAIRGMSP